jgi:hypothetical protein
MARRPFFSGNYGSALGSTANAANLIARAGETQGRMLANMGAQIGGMIQQYGLNKEKRERNENTAVGTLLGMAQNDQPSLSALMQNKDFAKAAESIRKGEGTAKQVDLVNSSTAAYRTQQMAGMQQKMSELNLSLQEALKDPTIKKAVAQANLAEAEGNYANSIVSEKYAGMVQDNALKSAQTAHQELLTKALENKEQYTPGVSKEPTPTAEATIDEHKSANEEAKSRGKMFYILNGKKFTVQ